MTSKNPHGPNRLLPAYAGVLLAFFVPLLLQAEIRVEHVTASTVYLDAGRAEGLAVGDRLRVVDRRGEGVAELEVAFVAEHSASCRLVAGGALPDPGLEAVPLAFREPIAEPEVARPEITRPSSPDRWSPAPANDSTAPRGPWARPSGSLSIGFQQFSNAAEFGSDLRESTGRLNLRLRDLAHLPMELRVRMRSRESRRGNRPAERRDRLYEASVAWAPPEGRFSVLGGRIGSSPFRGIGTLDGLAASFRPLSGLSVGAFAGSRPERRELSIASMGTKYGGYLQLSHRTPSGAIAEATVAGVGEYDPDGLVSREYVVVETRLGGGSRWSLFQTAELDLARRWDDVAIEQPSQLSLFSISGSFRFTDRLRAVVAYDQRQSYREAETRNLSEALFDDLVRQGLRVGLHFGNPRRWTGSVSFGQRQREGDDPVSSVVVSTYLHDITGWGLSFGLDASGYTGGTTDGYLATFRTRKVWRGGHELSLLLGTSSTTLNDLEIDRANHWARLEGTLELPSSLYLRGGFEIDVGDDLEGQRYFLEIGYRF